MNELGKVQAAADRLCRARAWLREFARRIEGYNAELLRGLAELNRPVRYERREKLKFESKKRRYSVREIDDEAG